MKLPKLNLKLSKIKLPQMTKNQWILSIAVAIFLLLDIIAGIVLLANKNKSAVRIVNGNQAMSRLYALDSAASKGTVNEGYANFKFTKEQKEYFCKTYQENGSVALTVCLQLMPTKKQKELLASEVETVLRYGFLTGDDFTIDGNTITIKNFSIINGGQTTKLIGETDFSTDFFVQCKIIKFKRQYPKV